MIEFHRLKEEGKVQFTKNPALAVECYTKALNIVKKLKDNHNIADRSIQEVYSNRSALYLHLGQMEEAKKDALRCIKLNASWFKVSLCGNFLNIFRLLGVLMQNCIKFKLNFTVFSNILCHVKLLKRIMKVLLLCKSIICKSIIM